MYQIIKDGAVLALTETPNYIKLHENGDFVLCTEEESEGVAYAGEAYHLLGRLEMKGLKTVLLKKVDAGGDVFQSETVRELMDIILGVKSDG